MSASAFTRPRVTASRPATGETGAVIRLLIADDEAMVRKGLRLVLETEDDLQVVGEAADGFEAI